MKGVVYERMAPLENMKADTVEDIAIALLNINFLSLKTPPFP